MKLTPKRQVYKRQGVFRRLLFTIAAVSVFTYLGSLVIQGIFVYTVKVNSEAMGPGLQKGDVLLVSPLVFGKKSLFSDGTWLDFAKPGRNALVVVSPPYGQKSSLFQNLWQSTVNIVTLGLRNSFKNTEESRAWSYAPVIRRVLGLPGDTVVVKGGELFLKPLGATTFSRARDLLEYESKNLRFPFLTVDSDDDLLFDAPPLELSSDEFFLISDENFASWDSRTWGPVDSSRLRGQVILRYWPVSKIGLVR